MSFLLIFLLLKLNLTDVSIRLIQTVTPFNGVHLSGSLKGLALESFVHEWDYDSVACY